MTTLSPPNDPAVPNGARARPRVLFVDDEVHVVEALAVAFRRIFDVTCATSGAEALALLEQKAFAVIVSDLRMPEMDGAELLAHARRRQPHAIRILLTGQAGVEDAIAAVNEGRIFRFLTKPCPSDVLHRALQDAIDQHRLVTADRALLEQKLEETRALLLHADRLATLGTLAAGVGHELNNVAQIMVPALQFTQERAARGLPPEAEDLAALAHVAEHLRLHATSLMQTGRGAIEVAGEIELPEVLERAIELLRLTGRLRGLDVRLHPAPGLPRVRAERVRLEQVFLNLIANAADAIHQHRREGTIDIQFGYLTDEGDIACTIADDGGGIPPEHLELIFQPYFTTKPADRGTGLGLPVVRQIVRAAGGDVSVRSTVGSGSQFSVRLPAIR